MQKHGGKHELVKLLFPSIFKKTETKQGKKKNQISRSSSIKDQVTGITQFYITREYIICPNFL